MKLAPLSFAALLSLVSFCTFAQTKAPEPDYTLAYNIALTSDYRYRGIAQTARDPALQAGIDFTHKSGFYLGTWGSNVSWVKDFNGATKGNIEVDFLGGYKKEVAPDVTLDVGAVAYLYPKNNSGAAGTPGFGFQSNANTKEIYLGATYKIATAKLSRSMGDYLGFIKSSGSTYFEVSANFDLGNGYTLTPRAGSQKVANNSNYSYADLGLTLNKDLGKGWSVAAAATGTNAKHAFYTDLNAVKLAKPALALSAKYSF